MNVLFSLLATVYLLSAFEEFIRNLGQIKGLLSPIIIGGMLWALGLHDWASLVIQSLAGGFAALWVLSTIQGPTTVTRRDTRLPKRVPPL